MAKDKNERAAAKVPTVVVAPVKVSAKSHEAAVAILDGINEGSQQFSRACDVFITQVVAMAKSKISFVFLIDTAKESGAWPVRDGKPMGHNAAIEAGCAVAMQLKSFQSNFLNRIELDELTKVPKMAGPKPQLKAAFQWNGNSIKQSGVKTGAQDQKATKKPVTAPVVALEGVPEPNVQLACLGLFKEIYGRESLTMSFVTMLDVFNFIEADIHAAE